MLLDAFERLARRMPSARLVIAGGGWDEAEVRRRAAASPAAAQIELLGNVRREELAATLARGTVYCLPSFGEPYGMSALEAMAAGLPLVVTRAGGLQYLLPAEGGLQVSPRDPDALAEALHSILRSPELGQRMGAVNREHVRRHHGWDTVLDRLEAIYAGLLQKKTVPASLLRQTPDAAAEVSQ